MNFWIFKMTASSKQLLFLTFELERWIKNTIIKQDKYIYKIKEIRRSSIIICDINLEGHVKKYLRSLKLHTDAWIFLYSREAILLQLFYLQTEIELTRNLFKIWLIQHKWILYPDYLNLLSFMFYDFSYMLMRAQ